MQQRARIARPFAAVATVSLALAPAASAFAEGQAILFDFENAPLMTPLPIDVSAGGVTAHLSGTGQGYSVQMTGTVGIAPAGFSGKCIFPSSVYASDLLIGFSKQLTGFSILYAAQELDCDCSSTLKVTAYMDSTLVGSATKSAVPGGVYPSATLAFGSSTPFNRVVVHYQSPPPCGCDYGVIFLADNMQVTPAPTNPADLNGDGRVDGADLGLLLGAWGTGARDLTGDGMVDGADLGVLLGAWTV